MELERLYVERDWKNHLNQMTILKTEDNKVKAIITNANAQPRKKKDATYTIRGKEYQLDYSRLIPDGNGKWNKTREV